MDKEYRNGHPAETSEHTPGNDLQKKISAILEDMPKLGGAVKGNEFGRLTGEQGEAIARRLRKALEKLKVSIEQKELDPHSLDDARTSVDGILDYMIRASKMSVSELHEVAKSKDRFNREEAKAAQDKSTAIEKLGDAGEAFRLVLYQDRVSILHWFPTLMAAGKYNMSVTRIEQILVRSSVKRYDIDSKGAAQ